jgi:hypothetical protein
LTLDSFRFYYNIETYNLYSMIWTCTLSIWKRHLCHEQRDTVNLLPPTPPFFLYVLLQMSSTHESNLIAIRILIILYTYLFCALCCFFISVKLISVLTPCSCFLCVCLAPENINPFLKLIIQIIIIITIVFLNFKWAFF